MQLVSRATELIAKDQTSTAISYFTSVRVPAALVAGSSLAALFSLADEAREGQQQGRVKRFVLLGYHICALMSLLLSLNTVVTATATANKMLLGCQHPVATSAFELLCRDYEFEYLFTRWSFFCSLFSFLGCVTSRSLLEFGLLSRKRVRSALLVVFSVGTLFFHMLSFVNNSLLYSNNMATMTWAVLRMWFHRAVAVRTPLEIASLICFFCALTVAGMIFAEAYQRPASPATINEFLRDENDEEETPIYDGTQI